MKKLYKYLLFTIPFILFSCGNGKNTSLFGSNDNTKTVLSPKEYTEWVKDKNNDLNRVKEVGEIEYELQYKPIDYMISMDEGAENLSDTTLERKRKEQEGMLFFDFKIKLKSGEGELLKYNLSSTQEYEQRVNYFSFGIQNDITL